MSPSPFPCPPASHHAYPSSPCSEAAKLLHSTLAWRPTMHNPPFSISEFEPEIKSGKIYLHGNDRAGRSILVGKRGRGGGRAREGVVTGGGRLARLEWGKQALNPPLASCSSLFHPFALAFPSS